MKIRKKIFDKNFDILFVKKREKKVCFSIIKLYTVDQRKGAVFWIIKRQVMKKVYLLQLANGLNIYDWVPI